MESRNDAKAYAAWLSRTTGQTYRLPSEAEWEAARRMAERKVLEAQASAPAPPDVDILKKPRDRRPYLLSAKSQDELIREKRIKGWLGLAVFLGGVGMCAWALQLRGLI